VSFPWNFYEISVIFLTFFKEVSKDILEIQILREVSTRLYTNRDII